MSANVQDRQTFSLVINTPAVAEQLDSPNQQQEIATCQDCFGTGWKRIIINNRSGVVRCNSLDHSLQRITKIGVNNTHKHCSFFNYRPKNSKQQKAKEIAEKFVDNFLTLGHKNAQSIIFYGYNQTGKTHLSVGILRELILAGKISVDYGDFFDTVFSFISDLEQVNLERFESYKENEPWPYELPPDMNKKRDKFFYENFLQKELVVLDNFSFKHISEMEGNIFSHLVAHRYNHSLPIILATRLSLEQIQNGLPSTTFSKLMDLCQFVSLS